MSQKQSRMLLSDEFYSRYYPRLGKILGRAEAIILDRIYYWLTDEKSGKTINGIKWIYNSYTDWQKQCCDMSETSIKRAIKSLRKLPLIVVTNKFSGGFGLPNQTNWYTIIESNHTLLERFLASHKLNKDLERRDLLQWIEPYSHYPLGQFVSVHTLYNKENCSKIITYTTTDVFHYLLNIGFSKKISKELIDCYGTDYVLEKIKIYYFEKSNGIYIKNPCAWMRSAIENNYIPTTEMEKIEEKRKVFEVRAQVFNSLRKNN